MTEKSTRRLLIDNESAGTRLDLFLTEHFKPDRDSMRRFSRSEIQRLIGEGQITLNGVKTKAGARVRSNDRIDIHLLPPRDTTLSSEALPLEIIHEDADCIVINKAPGITVHPAAGHWSGTLVNALLHHCPDIEGIGGERRPGIVHRLDKDTSGVMIVAKNTRAYGDLVLQFKQRSVEKEYIALAWGKVMPDKGLIDRPIGRHRSDRKKMSSIRFSHRSRAALTEWTVEQRFVTKSPGGSKGAVSLLRLHPHTGRTHQLRVHLADFGHPLLGDRVYGKHESAGKKTSTDPMINHFPRQALHAAKLVITYPRTGERMTFAAPLPPDFLDLLDHLRIADSKEMIHRG
jgi:23S rRNA pseudouridine1911/1915/1917 synthase